MRKIPRRLTSVVAAAVALALVGATPSAYAETGRWSDAGTPTRQANQVAKPKVVYDQLELPDGRTAKVYSNGLVVIADLKAGTVENRKLPAYDLKQTPSGPKLAVGKAQVVADLLRGTPTPYRTDRVRVVLAGDVHGSRDVTTVSAATLGAVRRLPAAKRAAAAPAYTSSPALNGQLARVGARKMAAQFPDLPSRAARAARSAPLDLTRAYVLDLAGENAGKAVEELLASPQVAYAAPAWTVSPMNVRPTVISDAKVQAARDAAHRLHASALPHAEAPGLPSNYALTASMQSLLNKPGINWTQAYQLLQQRYGQLPGEGQIITNVSIGDLNGATTVVQDGHRYLDLPSLPLIPTYTASLHGSLDPTGMTFGQDASNGEIDLDFAMMAALPHDLQREGAEGAGYTDLLGVAPGADYRLVVPATTDGVDVTEIDAAFLAAAQQSPHPDVITASLGFGFDTLGFPGRYLEDDQLTQALVRFIVDYYDVVVCISAGDGLRQYTAAAYGPSGGSAPTNLARRGTEPTELADVYMSDTPSLVRDSGAIDVGGTTLDDIFSAPPQDPGNAALKHRHAFPIVRYNGMLAFSSGFGSRVNVSAPGDNVIAFRHSLGGGARDVTPVITGGTSASAPIVAAAAAVVRQTAELVGEDELASNPRWVRSWLTSTGDPVPNVPQADQPIHVGPQVDLGEAVSRLVRTRTGDGLAPGVARVAVEQRRLNDSYFNAIFLGDTDPSAISLTGNDQLAWITIAPDWLGSAARARKYELTVGDTVLATTPYARVQPEQLFDAAGRSWPPSEPVSIPLTYTAHAAGGVEVSTDIVLGFQAASGGVTPLAPDVPPVVSGGFIPVTYDLSDYTNIDEPVLVVSEPGRASYADFGWRIRYQQVLSRLQGTVRVPVSALDGGGIYGVSIQAGLRLNVFTNTAFTRVVDARSGARPPVPTVSTGGSGPTHTLEIPYGASVTVRWDVRDVPHTKGARLEVSTPGPSTVAGFNSRGSYGGAYAMFNNPNGTARDANGIDTGSVHDEPLPGKHGSITLSADELGLVAGTYQQVRVRPVDRKGRAAGEASGSSTIHRFGVTGPDGQPIRAFLGSGFDIDEHGPYGLIVSGSGVFADGPAAVTQFDQRTNTTTRTLASASSGHAFGVLNGAGPAVFAGHMGLYRDLNTVTDEVTFWSVDLTTGEQREWTPPEGYLPDLSGTGTILAADNQSSPDTAFVAGFTSQHADRWKVFTSNIAAGTFGPAYSLGGAVADFTYPTLRGLAQDPEANKAYVLVADFVSQQTRVVEVDLADGSTRTIMLPSGCGGIGAAQIAVLPGAGKALIGSFLGGEACVTDLESGQATKLGILSLWVAADSTRNQFLVFRLGSTTFPSVHSPGNVYVRTADMSQTRKVLVLDAEGKLLRSVGSLQLSGGFISGSFLQVNPSTGMAYTYAPDGLSLQPFRYTD